jgi:hypothetical protein
MQRNPYWPLNGPSFFLDHRDSAIVYFTHWASRAVGSGSNFAARMASRRNIANMLDPKLVAGWRYPSIFRVAFNRLLR